MNKNQYTLSQLANSLQLQMAKLYPGEYWIVAEINKLNFYPKSGHCYPQLVEKRDGQIVAEMRGFIGRDNYARLHDQFAAETGRVLTDGMQILFRCKLSFQAVHGLSLIIVDIEPGFSLGEMARMRMKAIERLKQKRLFDANKQKTLVALPKRIAIISVVTSKGYRDFLSVIESSSYCHGIKIKLFPALLQGDAAVESIRKALRIVAASQAEFDAVAIIRGGGKETGLDCYDQYELAESVATFPLPVLAGIGHSTNITVVEQVAHTNLITPTDLARWLVEKFQRADNELNLAVRRIKNFRNGRFEFQKRDLRQLSERLVAKAEKMMSESKLALQSRSYRMMQESKYSLRKQRSFIDEQVPLRLSRLTMDQVSEQREELAGLGKFLHLTSQAGMGKQSAELGFLADKLGLLDPDNILKRGYSITLVAGKVISGIADAQPGMLMETRLKSGTIKSEIKSTTNG